jgi:hypothetical protein
MIFPGRPPCNLIRLNQQIELIVLTFLNRLHFWQNRYKLL